MSRKDYNAIAEAFKSSKPITNSIETEHKQVGKIVQWQRDVRAIADALSLILDRFDRQRFYSACGFDMGWGELN